MDSHGCFPYPDKGGRFTFGLGIAPIDVAAAQRYPWRTVSGSTATPADIMNAWATITSYAPDNPYAWSYFASKTVLRLAPSIVEQEVDDMIPVFEAKASKRFPEYANWPSGVQLALMDMAWNIGPNFEDRYPHFVVAMNAENWVEASNQCDSHGTPHDRIAARKKLLVDATSPALDPNAPPWP